MENNNNVNVTANESKEKKPSVFKTICSFIGFGIGAWLFITIATGGFDDDVRDIEQSVTDVTQGKVTVEEVVDAFVDERTEDKSEQTTTTTSGYRTADELEITWDEEYQEYKLYVDTVDHFVEEPYYTTAYEWLLGKSCYMMDNFMVEYPETMTLSGIYSKLNTSHWMYTEGNMFFDYRGINAVEELNSLMRTNDHCLSIIIEGQILNIEGEGNVIQIFDMSTTDENVYKYDNGINSADLNCYVDISMLDNKDEYFVNDTVTIYADYLGRVKTTDGSYQPLIVAVAMELQ